MLLLVALFSLNSVRSASLASSDENDENSFKNPLFRDPKTRYFRLDPTIYQNPSTNMNHNKNFDSLITDPLAMKYITTLNPRLHSECYVNGQLYNHYKNIDDREVTYKSVGQPYEQKCEDSGNKDTLFLTLEQHIGNSPDKSRNLAYHLSTAIEKERNDEDNKNINEWLMINSKAYPNIKTRQDFNKVDEKYKSIDDKLEKFMSENNESFNQCKKMTEIEKKNSLKCQKIDTDKDDLLKKLRDLNRPRNFPSELPLNRFPVKFSIPMVCRSYNKSDGGTILALNATRCGGSHCTCLDILRLWSPDEPTPWITAHILANWQTYVVVILITGLLGIIYFCSYQCRKNQPHHRYNRNYHNHRSRHSSQYSNDGTDKLLPKTETFNALGYSQKVESKKFNLSCLFKNSSSKIENCENFNEDPVMAGSLLSKTNRIYSTPSSSENTEKVSDKIEKPQKMTKTTETKTDISRGSSHPPHESIIKKSVELEYYAALREQDLEQHNYRNVKPAKLFVKKYYLDRDQEGYSHTPERIVEFGDHKYLQKRMKAHNGWTEISYEWRILDRLLEKLHVSDKEFRASLSQREGRVWENRDRYTDVYANFNRVHSELKNI